MSAKHLSDFRDSWDYLRVKVRRYAWFYLAYAMSNVFLTAVSLNRLSVYAYNVSLYMIIIPGITGTVMVTYKKIRRFRSGPNLAPSVYHRFAYLAVFFLAGVCAEIGFLVGGTINYYLIWGQ